MQTPQPDDAEELSPPTAWELVRQAAVGRLAVVVDGKPEIFPVTPLVDHGTVVFRTAVGTKLSGCIGKPVAFEIDGYDPVAGSAWSVVIKGHAHEIRRTHEMIESLGLPLTPWHPGVKPRFVRIEPDTVTGRRFAIRAQ